MKRGLVLLALVAGACSHHGRPTGPPPEYERPTLPPWDAGKPVDPLDQVEGEAVDDYGAPAADAGAAEDGGPDASPEAGVPSS